MLDNNAANLTQVREGTAVVSTGGSIGQMPARLAYAGDRLAFTAPVVGVATTANLYVQFDGAELAQKGSPAPGIAPLPNTTAPTFATFLGEAVFSNDDAALIRATVAGGGTTAANNEGLWSNRNAPGTATLALVMRKGIQAPLMATGVTIKKFISYHITNPADATKVADILAFVQVGGPGITAANDQVLYASRDDGTATGVFSILAREGNRLPGADGALIGVIQTIDYTTRTDDPLSLNSYYGILATLVNEGNGATAATNLVWLVGDSALGSPVLRLPQVHLRKGATSEGPVGKHTIASFTLPVKPLETSGAGNTGLPHAVSAGNRSSSLLVTYPDRSLGIMTLFNPVEGF
jgi:hypothetical protein